MTENEFDFDQVFGDDYLYFYASVLTDEVSDRQATVIAKLLDLQPGQRVLDCPCGRGRIANRLADRGAKVTGIDVTPHFLEVARQSKSGVDYRLGDMRELDFEAGFDAVINVFTSFGYFDDAVNKDVLRRFRRALKPGGKLLIEHQNAHRMVGLITAAGGSSDHFQRQGDDFLVDRTTYDAARGCTTTERTSIRGGRVRSYRFFTRLFTPSELTGWLTDAGFVRVDVYDQEGNLFSPTARRMTVVAS